jgi:hypothetical protein
MKKNGGGGELKSDVFDVRTFVNVTMYSTQHNSSNNKSLKVELVRDLAVPFLYVCLKGSKSSRNRETCTAVFVAALFTIVKS